MTVPGFLNDVAQCFRHDGPPRQWWCDHGNGSWSWCNTEGHRALPWRHHGGPPVTPASLLGHGWFMVPASEWHDAVLTLRGMTKMDSTARKLAAFDDLLAACKDVLATMQLNHVPTLRAELQSAIRKAELATRKKEW